MNGSKKEIRHVELVAPNYEWPRLFNKASIEISGILGQNCIDIHHIGSTSIPNIYAKPIIDMLAVVEDIKVVDSLNSKFEALGYICMGEYGISGRRYYCKTKHKRTHNIHLFEQGALEILRYLSFRNYMRENEDYARAYSVLKCCLAEVFPEDIDNYSKGKSSFIQMIDYKTGTDPDRQIKVQDDIIIQPYAPAWQNLAKAEIKAIKTISKEPYVSIDHVGSTAVPGQASEPIIDILISLQSIKEVVGWISPLESLGYCYWEGNSDKANHHFYKGEPPFGEKRTHSVHLVEKNNCGM